MLILKFKFSNSQNFIDRIIYYSEHWANEKLRFLVEVYNENKDKLERLTLNEFNKADFPATHLWLNYKVIDENLMLTELGFPFNLNCTTP